MTELKNINFSYDEKQIINDFSLKVNANECVCLYGESGCGKTTVLKIIAGLLKPQSGSITNLKNVSYVFQEDRLIPHLSVLQNVTLFLPKDRKAVAKELIGEAGLIEFINKKPDELSGGMKRRLSIVRAVAFGGDALLLDEPFNGLDTDNKVLMANIINREFTEKGKPIIMVSHVDEDIEILNAKKIYLKRFRNTKETV
ncbi:MAG: ATP-binding cassette domain-containing protein [Clostridia bacterium]|nr:ATP-binding cassette domain-containing protein [Clostridia bacterium]